MSLYLKPEVRFASPLQALPVIIQVVEGVYKDLGYETVITSLGDGKHKKGSFHPQGLAVDFRTKHVLAQRAKDTILASVKARLPQCDVLLEGLGTPNEHLHVEWDATHDNQPQVSG